MNSFVWLISLLAILGQTYADCDEEIEETNSFDTRDICRTTSNWALIPHPHDCHKFVVCANHVPEEFTCAENYYFDKAQLRCKLGSCSDTTKECHGEVRRIPEDCSAFQFCINGVYELFLCPPDYYYHDSLAICLPIENTPHHQCACIMPDYAVLKNPNKCQEFYMCVDGRAVPNQCGRGYYFDEHIGACIPDMNGVCVSPPRMTPEESAALKICNRLGLNDGTTAADGLSFIPDATDCAKFFMCVNGRAVAKQCPNGFYYNRELRFCEVDRNGACDAMKEQADKKKEQEELEALEKEHDKPQHGHASVDVSHSHHDGAHGNHGGELELNLSGTHDKETKPSGSASLSMTHVKVGVEKEAAETTHGSGSAGLHVKIPEHSNEVVSSVEHGHKTEKHEHEHAHSGEHIGGLDLGLSGTHEQESKPNVDLSVSLTHVKVGIEKEGAETTHNSGSAGLHVQVPEHSNEVVSSAEHGHKSEKHEHAHSGEHHGQHAGELELNLSGTHEQESKPNVDLSLSLTHVKVGLEKEGAETTHNSESGGLHVKVPEHNSVVAVPAEEHKHEHLHGNNNNDRVPHEDNHVHGAGEIELNFAAEHEEEKKPSIDLSLSMTHIKADVEKESDQSIHTSGTADLHVKGPEHNSVVAVPAEEHKHKYGRPHEDNHDHDASEIELSFAGEHEEEKKPAIDLSLSMTHVKADAEKQGAESTHNSGTVGLHIEVPEHHFMEAIPINQIEEIDEEEVEEASHSIEMKLPLSEALQSEVKLPTKNTYDKLASKFMNF